MADDRSEDQAIFLERYRSYLGLLARLQVEQHLRARIDLSGVVQQTLFEAHRSFLDQNGQSREQVGAWLRTILRHNLADEIRKHNAGRRDVGLDRSLDAALEESASRFEHWLAADQSSPSGRAGRNEEWLLVAEAIAELPDAQRTAIELHYLLGKPLAEIARELGCSKPAVAGLLHRGMKSLRARLGGAHDAHREDLAK